MLGSIFVDSQGSIAACEDFLERIGFLRLLRRFLHDDVDCLHPKERLGHLASRQTIHYDTKEENGRYSCQVRIGTEADVTELGDVVEGLTPEAVETEAAEIAAAILDSERDA